MVGRARALRDMPVTAAALAEGRITPDHVRVLCRARTAARAADFGDAEALLVQQAQWLRFADFERAVAYWCQLADPHGAADEAEQQEQRRAVHAAQGLGGVGYLDAVLDPMRYTVVAGELDRLEQHEFHADRHAARAARGDDATAADLPRTAAQRRADALVEMARRSAAMAPGARRADWCTNLHLDWATFCAELAAAVADGDLTPARPQPGEIVGAGGRPGPRLCELADGTPVLPSRLLPVSIRGQVRRVVFGATGEILDFGRRRRLFTGPTGGHQAAGPALRRLRHPRPPL